MGYQDNSCYAPSYLHTTPSLDDGQSSRPASPTNKGWLSHSHFGDVVFSPDSPLSPCLSYIDEPWSPVSASTDTDDDASLASSVSSLSPTSDLDTFPGEPVEDEDEDHFFSSLASSKSLYHPLEKYQLHSSSLTSGAYLDDDDLSPLTFSPPTLVPLDLLPPSDPGQQSVKRSFTYISPFQPLRDSFFDFDPSAPVPCSPSRRRSATLPALEPSTFDTDLFGLHNSVPESPPLRHADMDVPEIRWCSFPGCETDDDLIPSELASKKYIPDPSIIVPTISTGKSSLLLWDNDFDDRSDIPTRRSPPPEEFYLDPTTLAECGDEELRKVYELRQRTSKNEKWERERCRELSALLRLKLDERTALGGGEGGDCHQSGSRSLSCYPSLPFSSSPSSDSLTVHQPRPRIASSFSSAPSSISPKQDRILVPASSSSYPTLPLTSVKSQSEGPKHKIRNMSQLVASMLFNRQCDALRRHPSRKAGVESTSYASHCYPSLSMGAGMKAPSTPRSRLSKAILPEELEVDSEETQGLGMEEKVNEVEEDYMEVDDDGSLSRSCLDMDLDKGDSFGNSSSRTGLLDLEGKGWSR